MSVLDTMMRMQQEKQQQVPEAMNRLGDTLGNMLGQRGQRSFQQEAAKFFLENDVSPESIQKFSALYPQVNPQEILQVAGQVSSQKKAQRMKDQFKNMRSIAMAKKAAGKEFSASDLMDEMQDLDPDMIPVLTKFQQIYGPDAKFIDLAPGHEVQKTVGGMPVGDRMKGPAVAPTTETVTMYGPNGQTQRVSYQKGGDFKPPEGWTLQPPLQTPPGKMKIYNLKKGTEMEVSKEVADALKAQGGWGDEKLTYAPKDDPDASPKRSPWRNTETGGVEYFNQNDPKDRAFLKQNGNKYQAIAENPLSPVIRESLSNMEATTATPAKIPAGAKTGTYKGVKAYTLDEKTFFDMNGKKLN
jgi:hypothetical protein